MFDRPNRRVLLAAAQQTLMQEILPQLDGATHRSGLMVAAAMAIVIREIDSDEDGDDPLRPVLDCLLELYGENTPEGSDNDVRSQVRLLNDRLAQDIRAGRFDQALASAVAPVLLEQIRQRLQIANPGFLEDGVYSQP